MVNIVNNLISRKKKQENVLSKSCFTLTDIKSNQIGVLLEINAGVKNTQILAEMGLIGSVPITLIRNNGKGPIIISVRGTQIIVGRNLASKILVRRLHEGELK